MACQKRKLVQPLAESSNYDNPIPSKRLKEALTEATGMLGRAKISINMQSNIKFLERNNANFDGRERKKGRNCGR